MARRWSHYISGFVTLLALVKQSYALSSAALEFLSRPPVQHRLNNRPLVGILSQPGSPAPPNHTYFAASYVKYVEAGGARAVPIQCDLSDAELAYRFAAINGLLIPGGGQPLFPGHCYYDAALKLLQMAIAAAKSGDHFPVHATCLGFEALAIQLSDNITILSDFDAENLPTSLQPTKFARRGRSKLWNSFPSYLQKALQARKISMGNHAFGLSVPAFRQSQGLANRFNLVATSRDRQGEEYVAAIEGKQWPIYGFQSHPEKPPFEWAPFLDIPHDPDAVDASIALARFFGNEARRSRHKADSRAAEDEMLIYNWSPSYTGKYQQSGVGESSFEQCYFFPMAGHDRANNE